MGEPNVDKLLTTLTDRQFREWQEYFSTRPFGEEMMDMRFAQLCALMANINKSSKAKPSKISDFIMDFGKPKQSASVKIGDFIKASMKGFK